MTVQQHAKRLWREFVTWLAKPILNELESKHWGQISRERQEHKTKLEEVTERVDKYVKQFTRVAVEGIPNHPQRAAIRVEYNLDAFGLMYGSNEDKKIISEYIAREVAAEIRRSVYVPMHGYPVVIPEDRR